jgi:hypothetical protein
MAAHASMDPGVQFSKQTDHRARMAKYGFTRAEIDGAVA